MGPKELRFQDNDAYCDEPLLQHFGLLLHHRKYSDSLLGPLPDQPKGSNLALNLKPSLYLVLLPRNGYETDRNRPPQLCEGSIQSL